VSGFDVAAMPRFSNKRRKSGEKVCLSSSEGAIFMFISSGKTELHSEGPWQLRGSHLVVQKSVCRET